MKRPYETVVVFDGTLPSEVLQQEQNKVEDLIKQVGDFEKTDIWGNRRLAYEIKKKKSGYYCLFIYESDQDVALQMEKSFKLNHHVLRHMTLVRDLDKKIFPEKKSYAAAQSSVNEEGEEENA